MLIVSKPEPLEVLEQWTVEKFSAVRNNNAEKPSFAGHALTPKQLQVY